MFVAFKCAQCGKTATRERGHVNRARSQGNNLYCGRRCSGLGRRSGKTKAQKIAEKAMYDAKYRERNRVLLKAKKAAYFKRTYDPKKAAKERKKRAPQHAEYCRRPEYKAWKAEYDKNHRARKYGPYADAFLLLQEIDREVNSRMSDYDVRVANGTLNKRLQRKREYEKVNNGHL